MISIIVPVYNAESTIEKCLKSIKNQTFTDFEVILIDDGSSDNSGVICDKYSNEDSRFRVFHQKNNGVSCARQAGIEKAQGEYVIHADPDDWVEETMLEDLLKMAIDTNADVVLCDYYINDNIYVKQQPSNLHHEVVLKELFQHLHGSCCNKLLRRECYEFFKVQFPKDLCYCEDLVFWVKLLKHPLKITYLPKAYYHYIQHQNSAVFSYMNNPKDQGWILMNIIRNELKDNTEIRHKACERIWFNVVNDAYNYGKFSSFQFMKRYSKYIPYIMQNKTLAIRNKLKYVKICLGLHIKNVTNQ